MRRESKPCAGKGLHFYLSLWNKQGRVQFSAHSIPEKAQFFSSGRRPWIISKNVTLCISAFVCCSAKPSDHISVSNWHHRFRTLFISRWTTCLLFIFQMASSQEPLPPPTPSHDMPSITASWQGQSSWTISFLRSCFYSLGTQRPNDESGKNWKTDRDTQWVI